MQVISLETIANKHQAKLEIWDTPSSSNYASLVKAYYKSIQGALIVYDISQPNTLENARKLMSELPNSIQRLLVANKCDLNIGSLGPDALGVSARNGTNVKDAFQQLIRLTQCF